MKYRIRVKKEGEDESKAMWEDVEDDKCMIIEEAWFSARALVQRFNETLHPGETPRVFLNVEADESTEFAKGKHSWSKWSLVTEAGGYDIYRCETCDITGKRYEVEPEIIRDSKYKAKVYARCDTAQEYLKRNECPECGTEGETISGQSKKYRYCRSCDNVFLTSKWRERRKE